MRVVQATRANLEQLVNGPGIVFIDWWAPGARATDVFESAYDEAARRFPSVTFARVNVADQPDLAATYDVRSVPTLMAFRDQTLVYLQTGEEPQESLDDLVHGIEALDMEEARASVDGVRGGSRALDEQGLPRWAPPPEAGHPRDQGAKD